MDKIIPGRYRHFKGNEYEVLYIAKRSLRREGDLGPPGVHVE